MKTVKKIVPILLLASGLNITGENLRDKYDSNCPEKKIVVVIPSYNNKQWCTKNLDSVRTQNYKNFIVIYLNDCSKDQTGKLVEEYIQEYNLKNQFMLVNNTVRVGALENLYKAIHACKNEDIIVTLDGDDWFAHKNVLKVVNSIYQDPKVWLTYGQYRAIKGDAWWCTDFSERDIKNNRYRTEKAYITHLRTFYAGLFKLIKIEDLLYEGKFYPMTWDKAMMFPMIEMSGGKFKRIKDILYLYNDINPINDHKVDLELQRHLSDVILAKEPYKPATWKDIVQTKSSF